MFMLKYNYLTLRGESRLRPQYLLLYRSHFAVIHVEASPSNIFISKPLASSRFCQRLRPHLIISKPLSSSRFCQRLRPHLMQMF